MASRRDLFFGPGADGSSSQFGLRLLQISLAAVAIVVGAYLTLPMPGSPVPQSLQTLAVVLTGALLGPIFGGIAVLLYLMAGVAGLPVFADGASGWAQLTGPTGGYLTGFWVAAVVVGLIALGGRLRRAGPALGTFLAAHVLILVLGAVRLSVDMGMAEAVRVGVFPFLVGGALKSVLAALVVVREPLFKDRGGRAKDRGGRARS